MSTKSSFILGLPAAGKTTFLAALYYSLNCSESTKLNIKKYIGNQQYMSRLSETWLSVEKVARTSTFNEQKSLQLLLKDADENELQLSFPDISGESFQKQYAEREIDNEIAECITNSDYILLFINPEYIIEPLLISQIPSELRNVENDPPIESHDSIRSDPTEVQIVDLLQFIDYLKGSIYKSINLGVIISAWDIADSTYVTPEKFVIARLPLLWQYLTSNNQRFKVLYYGISAQGGSLNDENDTTRLIEIENPIKRILVVNNNGERYNDITLPLWELMNR